MADFNIAVAKTLANERGFFHNPTTGEVVNHGITLWFLRSVGIRKTSGQATPEDIQFVKDLRVGAATELYRQYFWTAGDISLLENQQLADKVFDLSVNNGLRTGCSMLQQALLKLGTHIQVDGKIGPETATAANAADQEKLYSAYLGLAEARYRMVAERHPDLAVDLDGWLERLHKT